MTTLIIFCAKYLIALPVVLLAAYALALRGARRKEVIALAVVSLPLTYAIGKLVGHFIYNARPFVVEHVMSLIAHAPDNGFPSDHTLLAACLAQVALHVNRRLGLIMWIFVVLIGGARVLAHVHHVADIVASASIAIIAVWVSERLTARFLRK